MCRGTTTNAINQSVETLSDLWSPAPFSVKQEDNIKQYNSFDTLEEINFDIGIPPCPMEFVPGNTSMPLPSSIKSQPFADDFTCLLQELPMTSIPDLDISPPTGNAKFHDIAPTFSTSTNEDNSTDLWAELTSSLEPPSPVSSLSPLSPLSPLSATPDIMDSSVEDFFKDCPISDNECKDANEANKNDQHASQDKLLTVTIDQHAVVDDERAAGGCAQRQEKRRVKQQLMKKERARQLNRIAARRHRQAKKIKEEEEHQKLEMMNLRSQELQNELIRLQAKKETLLSVIRDAFSLEHL